MSEPTSQAEYNQLFMINQHLSGNGILGTTQHMPCPWCAAAEWMVFQVINTDVAMSGGPYECSNCHRSGTFVIEREVDSASFELVQTGGPEPPMWLQPPPRRMS
jgi:hypothetical protein